METLLINCAYDKKYYARHYVSFAKEVPKMTNYSI